MKNLGSVFAAYMIGWAVFFLFSVSVARRTQALRAEVERLSARMKDLVKTGR